MSKNVKFENLSITILFISFCVRILCYSVILVYIFSFMLYGVFLHFYPELGNNIGETIFKIDKAVIIIIIIISLMVFSAISDYFIKKYGLVKKSLSILRTIKRLSILSMKALFFISFSVGSLALSIFIFANSETTYTNTIKEELIYELDTKLRMDDLSVGTDLDVTHIHQTAVEVYDSCKNHKIIAIYPSVLNSPKKEFKKFFLICEQSYTNENNKWRFYYHTDIENVREKLTSIE